MPLVARQLVPDATHSMLWMHADVGTSGRGRRQGIPPPVPSSRWNCLFLGPQLL